MKVFITSSAEKPINFSLYGGTEDAVGNLATAITKFDKVEEVSVSCCKGSILPKNPKIRIIETVYPSKDPYHDWFAKEKEAYRIFEPYLKDYGIICDNLGSQLIYTYKMKHPEAKICHLFHGPCPWKEPPLIDGDLHFICASRLQAMDISHHLDVSCEVIHHGINTDLYPFKEEKGDRYLSLNRICDEKGILEFINVMRNTDSKGDTCGEDYFIASQEYVQKVRSRCDGSQIKYYGTVSYEDKVRFFQGAKATISLPMYPFMEIFGLHASESMSCGTPVIGLRNGGLIDQIEDGKTGFLCDTLDEVEEVIRSNKIEEIDPYECRRRVKENFSIEVMAKGYLEFFKEMLDE
ncbi:MAG: Trehalose synthase [Candidatus Methanolliviera sp. GoM_oil]|nr:MAG: Trehalose synthase [Candidatus Methanolliviera sp. GoM_oil]